MIRLIFCAFLIVAAASFAAPARSTTIFVSPSGNDKANGSQAEAKTGSDDGPVRTLERARFLVREIRARATTPNTTTVLLRGGRYELEHPLTFGPEDSGSPEAPITYKSYPGEVAHIDGGRRIRDWRRGEDGMWSANYTQSWYPRGCPAQLFVGGERRNRPRLPASGTFQIERVVGKTLTAPQPNDRFFARLGDLPGRLDVTDETEVVVFDAWTASRMRLTSYDPTSRLLLLSGKFAGHGVHHDMTAGLPYFVENFRDRTLEEKSWQCDAQKREIRYRPASDESLDTKEVVAPHLTRLISLEGRDGQQVHDIHFEDIYFETTAWHLPVDGWAAMQAEVGLPGAIELRNANRITFSRFALVRTGASGIRVRENCFDIKISGGELRDLGGTGIALGSELRRPTPGTSWSADETSSARVHDITISDNLIASVGRIHWAAVGVWIGQADHILVERNEIRDLYYSGISVGWTWEYGPSLSHANKIIGNVISDFGQGVLSDMGGVYTLGRQSNSLVQDNIISNGKARTYGGHGLYADAGTAGFIFRNNVVTDMSHAGIHIHYGADLLFDGNFLFDYREAGVRCTRPSRGTTVVFRNNVMQSESAPPFFGVCKDSSYVFENNAIGTDGTHLRQSNLSRDARETIEGIRSRSGRLSAIRFTNDMRDGPRNFP